METADENVNNYKTTLVNSIGDSKENERQLREWEWKLYLLKIMQTGFANTGELAIFLLFLLVEPVCDLRLVYGVFTMVSWLYHAIPWNKIVLQLSFSLNQEQVTPNHTISSSILTFVLGLVPSSVLHVRRTGTSSIII